MDQVLENVLEGELDEELGYTKYDYRNKDTDNSRNGYSSKKQFNNKQRNTTAFISYKDIKTLMADLKRVYTTPNEEVALLELDSFEEKWAQSRRGWGSIHSQLEVFFEERPKKYNLR